MTKTVLSRLSIIIVLTIISQMGFSKNNNTGSVGINITRISDWSTQYPFLDFVKQARAWVSQKNDNGKTWDKGGELDLDKNGWVRSLKPSQVAELVFLTPNMNQMEFNRFVVTYKGKGKIRYMHAARIISHSSKGNQDVIYVSDKLPDSIASLQILETDPSNYIRDIKIVPEKYVELSQRGEIFNPDWIGIIDNYRAVRFMDWMKTNDSTQEYWKDRPKINDYTWSIKGVPIEIMISLANKLHADPWFNMPHLATDNYISQFANIVKNNLDESLTVYIEYSNEVWNGWFKQSQYANDMGLKRWNASSDPTMQWYGMRSAQMCDIWKKIIFGNELQRVHCVLSTQANNSNRAKSAIECPMWVNEGNIECYKHGFDSIGIAGYFSGCLNGKANSTSDYSDMIRAWFKDKDGGLEKAFEQLDSGKYFECNNTVEAKAKTYAYFYNIAKERGMSLTAYEGGQHVTGLGSKVYEDEDFIKFHIAINRDIRMKKMYLRNLEIWKKQGGTLFMHYLDISRPGRYGSWGLLEYLGQKTSPKYEALREFNTKEKCWWRGCE